MGIIIRFCFQTVNGKCLRTVNLFIYLWRYLKSMSTPSARVTLYTCWGWPQTEERKPCSSRSMLEEGIEFVAKRLWVICSSSSFVFSQNKAESYYLPSRSHVNLEPSWRERGAFNSWDMVLTAHDCGNLHIELWTSPIPTRKLLYSYMDWALQNTTLHDLKDFQLCSAFRH